MIERSPPAPASLPPSWPGPRAVGEILRAAPELQGLLSRLGFTPEVEGRWPALAAELKGLIEVEIPDYPALCRALEEVRSSLAAPPSPGDPLGGARWSRRDDPLLQAALAAIDEPERLRWLLARSPVDEALPFVEEIPFLSHGEVSWRRPMETPLLRKRPREPARFAALLDEAEALLTSVPRRGREQARREVLDALARLRRALEREGAYLPAPIQALEGKMEGWLRDSRDAASLARRATLEALLGGLAGARHRFGLDALSPSRAAAFRHLAQGQAGRYLESPWMHGPWLTSYVLATLLAAELAPLAPLGEVPREQPARVLRVIWTEVLAGRFDPAESIRRLRQLEAADLYVHSLVYTLLKMSRRRARIAD